MPRLVRDLEPYFWVQCSVARAVRFGWSSFSLLCTGARALTQLLYEGCGPTFFRGKGSPPCLHHRDCSGHRSCYPLSSWLVENACTIRWINPNGTQFTLHNTHCYPRAAQSDVGISWAIRCAYNSWFGLWTCHHSFVRFPCVMHNLVIQTDVSIWKILLAGRIQMLQSHQGSMVLQEKPPLSTAWFLVWFKHNSAAICNTVKTIYY